MTDALSPSIPPRDRAAECHTRAAADRLMAERMDTSNGRRMLEQSAASWDQRGELLGRLDASFNKRERLDAEARRFHSAGRAERVAVAASLDEWEGEGGATASLRASDEPPRAGRPGGNQATGLQR